jgi:CheY-like chemotaxis protein
MSTHILFVDDEPPIRELLSICFRKRGFQVSVACTVQEARQLARNTTFDLAILDLELGGENGLDYLRLLKSDYPHMPVIIFTGLDCDQQLLAQARSAGANALLSKTESLHTLLAEVGRHLPTAPRQGAPIFANNSRSLQRHVLVVDDEPLVCETVSMLLQSDGHLVAQASSGAEALALFEPGKFDLVFTDYFMPVMKGDELAAAIKRRSPGQAVVMLTAFPENLHDQGRPLPGIDLLMGKPFEIDGLRQALTRFAPPVQNLESSPSQA